MAFKPTKYDSGKTTKIKLVTSAAIARYDALAEDGNGLYQRATSAASSVNYVALEDVTEATASQECTVIPVSGVLFIADTNAAPVQTDVGTIANLTDHDTLDESSASTGCFFIEEIEGATTDKTVRGYFKTSFMA